MKMLKEILEHKRKEIAKIAGATRPQAARTDARDFAAALRSSGEMRLIAEIKRRSPSRGDLRPDLNPAAFARIYEESGAAAISVLTDGKFFGGSLTDLQQARAACTLPVLRKDFILEEAQIWQCAQEGGPDAILLIVAALSEKRLGELLAEAQRFGLACLVEVHSEADVETALAAGAKIIGINNRDLKTFTIDLKTTARLRKLIPADKTVVSESGIHGREDVAFLQGLGVNAMLVGEALVQSDDPATKIRELLNP